VAKSDRKERGAPASSPPVVSGDVLLGRVLDERYRIDTPLGVGGMGAVYRGTHLKLNSPVAIKLLLDQHTSSGALRKRFEREAKALAALAHPNIVAITDYGVASDIPYLVMELLEGEPLSRRLPSAPFAPSQVLELTQQLLRALSFVHERGLVHRDLKPANVFMQRLPDGEVRVKLLDFGLAKSVQSESASVDQHLTPAGEAVGTPAYMPPEQIAGGPPDARTDVYALGVILFQMLSGRLPFVGEPMEQLKSHLLAPVPSLSQAHPNGRARPELDAFLQRAMAKRPDGRFQDAAEMLAALDAIPQPWILAKEVEPDGSSDGVAMAPTMVDPRRAQGAGAPADAAGAGAPIARPSGVDRTTEPTARRKNRAFWPMVLVLFTAVGAAAYAIAVKQVRRSPSIVANARNAHSGEPAAHALQRGDGVAPTNADTAAPAVVAVAPQNSLAVGQDGGGAAAASEDSDEDTTELRVEPHEAPAPRGDGRVKAGPRPPPRNPWTRGTPKELRSIRKVIAAGGFSSDRGIALLRKYSHSNPDDPRGHLLLARLFINRHWRSDAVSHYAAAYQIDPSSRGAPQMLSDLLGLVAQGGAEDEASRLVQRAYGREALSAIDRALAGTRRDSAAAKRLRTLRARITG
jgi:serine/threonine-protein kinase